MKMSHRVLVLAGALGLGAAAASMTGCTERVIAARGPGADKQSISEPYYNAPKWEKETFGDPFPASKAKMR